MYNIIPLILILVSLSVIIAIVVRKFSVLANLDLDSIQAEREVKFKEQIISNRIKRNYSRYYSKFFRAIAPVLSFVNDFFKKQYYKLVEIKETPTADESQSTEILSEDSLELSFSEIDEHLKKNELDDAEKKLIDIIGKDSKNSRAFIQLGNLYFENKNYDEAEQTMMHALRLIEKEYESLSQLEDVEGDKLNEVKNQIASVYFDLSEVNRSQENLEKALGNIDKALEIQPNNPRYLDMRLDTSIMKKDKTVAQNTYERLVSANPENQKLEEIKKQIEEME